jgi:hypothetical protein
MWLRHEQRGRREVDDIQCVGFWKVVSLRCGPWELVQRWGGGVHMNRGRVGEDRGSKETDGYPLTTTAALIQGAHADIRLHQHYCQCPLTSLSESLGIGLEKVQAYYFYQGSSSLQVVIPVEELRDSLEEVRR